MKKRKGIRSISLSDVFYLNKVKDYLFAQPAPSAAFQISSRYLTGIYMSSRDKTVKHAFSIALEEGMVQASFNRKNIQNEREFIKKLGQGLKNFPLPDNRIALLLPELSQKLFIFSFDSLPASLLEQEKILRFRMKSQMARIPEDARISYDLFRSDGKVRALASIARSSVIESYEKIFDQKGLKVRLVSIPSVGILNILAGIEDKDFMVVNIENDSFSLIAAVDSEVVFYRQKPLGPKKEDAGSLEKVMAGVIQEIGNTAQYVEDREKKKIECLWIRLGLTSLAEEVFQKLEDHLPYTHKRIESALSVRLKADDKRMLSPLIGLIS